MSTIVLPYQLIRIISGTTSGTIGTQTTHAHGGGKVPLFYTIKSKANGVVYEGAVADATNIYIKGGAASLTFDAIVYFSAL
jgi:hypothetical protein